MDKQLLRSVIENLSEGQTVTVNFRSTMQYPSGDYVFLGRRVGRGKGGSLLAELSKVGSEDVVVTGTKDSDNVVSVVVDGTTHGLDDERLLPIVYDTDASSAIELKRTFKAFLKPNACPAKIVVESSVSELNREFTVTSARQLRGRVGQVQLDTAEGVKLCSYRHSGVIQEVRVLED